MCARGSVPTDELSSPSGRSSHGLHVADGRLDLPPVPDDPIAREPLDIPLGEGSDLLGLGAAERLSEGLALTGGMQASPAWNPSSVDSWKKARSP